jgi:uncharacterized protein YtpQ (UPF0354 family)
MSGPRHRAYRANVQVASPTCLPVIVPADDRSGDPAAPVLDAFAGDLAVAYSFGPPWGEQLVTWLDLDRLGLSRRTLRRTATDNLEERLDRLRVHGKPPALMLSFDGLESSLLLADAVWQDLAAKLPGEPVVGVPARDVVIVTGSQSAPGLDRARRAVDRVFYAGGRQLLIRDLLVRRGGSWAVLAEHPPQPGPLAN